MYRGDDSGKGRVMRGGKGREWRGRHHLKKGERETDWREQKENHLRYRETGKDRERQR